MRSVRFVLALVLLANAAAALAVAEPESGPVRAGRLGDRFRHRTGAYRLTIRQIGEPARPDLLHFRVTIDNRGTGSVSVGTVGAPLLLHYASSLERGRLFVQGLPVRRIRAGHTRRVDVVFRSGVLGIRSEPYAFTASLGSVDSNAIVASVTHYCSCFYRLRHRTGAYQVRLHLARLTGRTPVFQVGVYNSTPRLLTITPLSYFELNAIGPGFSSRERVDVKGTVVLAPGASHVFSVSSPDVQGDTDCFNVTLGDVDSNTAIERLRGKVTSFSNYPAASTSDSLRKCVPFS
jgi:hypothetical protein